MLATETDAQTCCHFYFVVIQTPFFAASGSDSNSYQLHSVDVRLAHTTRFSMVTYSSLYLLIFNYCDSYELGPTRAVRWHHRMPPSTHLGRLLALFLVW